jgi:RNA polymerase sigma-70 factor (ECF subfamily)
VPELPEDVADEASSAGAELRWDVWRLLGELKARDRQMLWLAYAEGSSHAEIATVLGLQEASVRSMLFRARQRLGELLREAGFRGSARAGGPR